MASLEQEQNRAELFGKAQTKVLQASREITEDDISQMRDMINENNKLF